MSLLLLIPCFLSGQDEGDTSTAPVLVRNDLGIGLTVTLPTGFYRQHLKGVYPGLSMTYYRNLGLSRNFTHYLGAELGWVELQTRKADLTYQDGNGNFRDYTRSADAEWASFGIWYRLQPDLSFWLWPYLEAGAGLSWLYWLDRERYPGQDDEEDEVLVDIAKSYWGGLFRFGAGLQYFITDLGAYLDLSWRYHFHTLARYPWLDDRALEEGELPGDLVEERRSHATSMQWRLSLNFIF